MIEGIRKSLQVTPDPDHLRFVAFLTDGYIGNETEILREVHNLLGPTRIFSFGVGSSVNRYLLDNLAKFGQGYAAYLSNTQDGGQDAAPRTVVFMPFAQELAMGGVVVVRADSNVARLAASVTGIVRRIAPTAPIRDVLTVTQVKDQSVAPRRLNAALVSALGILAVIIAAVGIAGVLAFSVSARTNEIGIRMSLGADRGRVQRIILAEGGVLLVLGLALGVPSAFFGARVMRGLLFGVAPNDPVTLVAVAAMMATIGVAACWVPARRASRIDPVITMRS